LPPRLLIFDVDGTLYCQSCLRRRLAPALLSHFLRHPRDAWRTLRILRAWRRSLEELRRRPGQIAIPAAQMSATVRATGETEAIIDATLKRWFHAAPLPFLKGCMRSGLIELLDRAAAAGARCAVFSDYEAATKLRAMGLASRFDAVLSSEDPRVQRYKPDPAGIRVLLDELRVAPAEAVYFGDRLGVDDEAARRAGVGFVLIGGRGSGFDQVDLFRRHRD
jgi:FMN phosphatase YigB (HAD superfamily)